MFSEHIINEFWDIRMFWVCLSSLQDTTDLNIHYYSPISACIPSIKYLFFHDWAHCIFPNHLLLASISQQNLVILFPVVFCFCDFVHIVPSSWDVIPYLPFLPSECLFIQQDPTRESILWGVLEQSIITYNSHLYKQRVISFVRPLYLYDNYIYICHTTLKIAI